MTSIYRRIFLRTTTTKSLSDVELKKAINRLANEEKWEAPKEAFIFPEDIFNNK